MKTVLKKINFLNYSILVPYLILSILGLVVVYSTTSPIQVEKGASPYRMVISQFVFWILSLVAIWILYHMKLKLLRNTRFVKLLVWIEIGLLAAARFVFPTVNGAHGWIVIGGQSIQPVEYLKILIIWQLAAVFAKNQEKIYRKDMGAVLNGGWFPQFVLASLLIIAMPDLGNLIMIVGLVIIMIFASGVSYGWERGYFIFGGAIFLVADILVRVVNGQVFGGPLARFAYINKRLVAFINPFEDVSDAGHQMINSYYAISNGGWFGRGLGNSIQKKGYLPEAHTDFVFSIVMEEFGLVGSMIILGILMFLILRIYLVGIKAKDPFNSMLCIGIGTLFLLQVFVNVGGLAGLIPETGVTFPFLSQGGNSLFILSIAVGFVLNISADEKRRQLVELNDQYDDLEYTYSD